jgi:hypothetical protein
MNCTITSPSIHIGDDKSLELEFTNSDGTAVDITGWTVYFSIKSSIQDSDTDAIFNTEIMEHSDPENGKTEIVITSGESKEFTAGVFIYGIRIKDDEDKIQTITKGNFSTLGALPNFDDES